MTWRQTSPPPAMEPSFSPVSPLQTVILCGGRGTRLREETEFRPKPMVEIGGRPILWHIMKYYASFGHKHFILALGYKGDIIRDYFLNYKLRNHDFTVDLGSGGLEIHSQGEREDWKVTLVETGDLTMTGARLKRCERYLTGDHFLCTYGDGLSNIPLDTLIQFHYEHGCLGTLSGVLAPSRFGELTLEGDTALSFSEKPVELARLVSGGFFVFRRGMLQYLDDDPTCTLERTPLERLAQESQLKVFRHDGFWASMDTYRDYLHLNEQWDRGDRPWARWLLPSGGLT